jgi:imidazole glycerol-phosphate synthase subunit HisF
VKMKNSFLKTRVIPVLLLRNGALVRSRKFSFYQISGDPFLQVERFNMWNVDELIYLDISRNGQVEIDKTANMVIGAISAGKKVYENRPKTIYEFIELLSKRCFMPLTFGGGVRDGEQARKILASGADKVVINTYAFKTPDLVKEISRDSGKQCVVVSIDYKPTDLGMEVFINGGKTAAGVEVLDWIQKAAQLGAGEILINSIERDGLGNGYDLEFYKDVVRESPIPVIICGGVGRLEHFSKGFQEVQPHALAAANFFNFIEHSDQKIKHHLFENGVNVRTPKEGGIV